ncbi:MAG: betaine/proline/choline family ABC transporter ATP-binding protein [Actinomycetota bacterium]|nr:betaine/proline/choline family ABC transporter ATP-binding protein [Actinomycetota bacterium]
MDAIAPAAIGLEAVSKRYDDGTVAVQELDLAVPRGELVVLVGPSGCGKSTTLRMVNRLIEPSSGRILLEGEDVTHADPVALRRRIGYVIQQVGLFPHLTIRANVATVPRLLGWNQRRTAERVDELLSLVGLDPAAHGDRYPHQLSGGQRQRVGVARALAADPPVLLMDEPFGAVDPVVRERLQDEFRRLQRSVGKTVLFVTHDIDEAVRLGDRIAVLAEGGRLHQYDAPATLLGVPATPFVAEFVGADRGLRRLAVTPVTASDLEHPAAVLDEDRLSVAAERLRSGGTRWAVVLDRDGGLHGWVSLDDCRGEGTVGERVRRMAAWVRVGSSLRDAFGQLLQHDAGWVGVLDERDGYLGVLTPATLHEALRRSLEADVTGQNRAEVELPTVRRA